MVVLLNHNMRTKYQHNLCKGQACRKAGTQSRESKTIWL